jgi:hypothetical protein
VFSILKLLKRFLDIDSKFRFNRRQNNHRHNKLNRRSQLEPLEVRAMLAAVPVASGDLGYSTAADTALVIGSSDHPLLENDWDPQGNTLVASIVESPSSGTLSQFN